MPILFSNIQSWLCCSEAYRYSGSIPAYSPDGRYLATAEDYKLVVRDVDTLQVVQLYSCLDRIKHLEWCCRSEYVLCGLTQRPIVQVSALLTISVPVHQSNTATSYTPSP